MGTILIDSHNTIDIEGLADSDGTSITDVSHGGVATVDVVLKDVATDLAISGGTLSLSYVSPLWRGTFAETLAIASCMECRAEITVDAGPGLHKEWSALYDAVYGSLGAEILLNDTDKLLTVAELKDATTDTYLNASTVEVSLADISGVDIAGQVWPTTVAHDGGVDGTYQANLADTLDVAIGDAVKVHLTAVDAGTGFQREWHSILTVQAGT